MPAASDRYYTREEVLAFPEDGNRYELVYGELLVSPSPALRHQLVLSNLHAALHEYLKSNRVGRVMFSPADITWGSDYDILVQPDLFVVAPDDRDKTKWDDLRHFLLFAEVLSPSTARYDRFTKRRLYQEKGVPLYWVIDPILQIAETWMPGTRTPVYEERRLFWHPDPALAPIKLTFDELFAD